MKGGIEYTYFWPGLFQFFVFLYTKVCEIWTSAYFRQSTSFHFSKRSDLDTFVSEIQDSVQIKDITQKRMKSRKSLISDKILNSNIQISDSYY